VGPCQFRIILPLALLLVQSAGHAAAAPGGERFVGLGLSGAGVDRRGLHKVFVDEYNAPPLGWDLFPDTLSAHIKRSYPPGELARSLGYATHQTTLDEFEKGGGARIVGRMEFHAERVAALAAATTPEACLLLATWQEKS